MVVYKVAYLEGRKDELIKTETSEQGLQNIKDDNSIVLVDYEPVFIEADYGDENLWRL